MTSNSTIGLCQRAVQVLETAEPASKVRLSLAVAEDWRADRIGAVGRAEPPDRPARPERPRLTRPGDMPKRSSGGSAKGRTALLHALAHIELNAIDLAWDLIARFTAEDLPRAFYDDWVTVAAEEAEHFALLSGRLTALGTAYGELPAHELRRGIGYCFQQVGLFPHMTVGENVGVTPRLLGWEPERTARRVDEREQLVELAPDGFRDRFPDQLSGGQQQRVGIARALAAEPEVMLLDEPFGALDPITRDRLQQSFTELRRNLGTTVMFVTHDMVEALLLGDRIGVMQGGRLVQLGTPAELLRAPADDYVAELMSTPRRQTEAVERLLGAS